MRYHHPIPGRALFTIVVLTLAGCLSTSAPRHERVDVAIVNWASGFEATVHPQGLQVDFTVYGAGGCTELEPPFIGFEGADYVIIPFVRTILSGNECTAPRNFPYQVIVPVALENIERLTVQGRGLDSDEVLEMDVELPETT